MFFHIARQSDPRFPHQHTMGRFTVSVDSGWHIQKTDDKTFLYKGYVDNGKLSDCLSKIADSAVPVFRGNFCVLEHDSYHETITIKTDIYRAFPLFYQTHEFVGNLRETANTIWSDSVLTVYQDFFWRTTQFDPIQSCKIVRTSVADIHDYLNNKIKNFVSNNSLPLKVFLSGGVDTLLLYSYIRALGVDHELVRCAHTDHDYFYLCNHAELSPNWGYEQIHHWKDSCVLVSGTPGDEFTMRSPTTAGIWLLANGTDMITQLDRHPGCLHDSYFRKPKHIALFQQQIQSWQPIDNLTWTLCNINVNDWQHWHLGNTLTWTPLRDLELFKMFLGLDRDELLSQIFNSAISRELIERNVPGLTAVISDQKNTGNYLKNLTRLML